MRETTIVEPEAWEAAVEVTDGPQLVVGGPGAGKTEFLVRRAWHLIEERGIRPEAVLVLSFSRRGVADLRDRIASRLTRSFGRIPAGTFHSLAMRIVEAHGASSSWPTVPRLLTGPEHVALVAEVLSGEDPRAWPQPFARLLGDPPFAEEVADFLLRAAERLMGSNEIRAMGRADWRGLPGFFERYRNTLVQKARIDYGTLQVEAVRMLQEPAIAAEVTEGVDYVLVDEFQDTTVAQAAIVEGVSARGNVTVAGDPYQSIYSFRGAELSNVDAFPDRFGREGAVHHWILNRSFRVPEQILEAAVRLTEGADLPGAGVRMTPAAPGGTVETHAFDQHSAETEWIAAEIERIHLRDRLPLDRIAVLVRSKRGFLSEMSRALERRKIPHDPPDARLVDHPVVRPVLDLVRAATGQGSAADEAVRRVLLGPLGGLPLAAVREIERSVPGQGWASALAGSAAPPELCSMLADPSWAEDVAAAEGFWRVWTALPFFDSMMKDPTRGDERRAIASFGQSLARLAERDPDATLADYSRLTETEEFEATPLLEFRGDRSQVALTTLHQAKGLTFDVVFIADASEGVLPDLRSRDSVLGARHLSPSHRGDDTAYGRFRLQEERRLAYTAMCRASSRVVWTCTTAGFSSGDGVPSRFIPVVADLPLDEATRPPPISPEPTTPLEAEAWLRRRLADPMAPAVDRLSAAAALLGPAPWRPRNPSEYAGVLEPGPDTGLVGDRPTLSASQADAYRRCPRRYAFERRLAIDDGGSMYQELGSVIHAALERAERSAAESGHDHARAEDALSILDDLFEPAAFGGGAWAHAWRNRADRIVTRLYELWPGAGPGIGFEEEFEVELGGSRWRGRIDRVEARDDGVHVVDYKTGTQAVSVSDAARSMQLGLYVRGLEAKGSDEVAGGEFWYPAHNMERAKSVSVRRLDPELLEAIEQDLEAAARGISDEAWPATPGAHCERCPVRLVCTKWPEGREAFAV